MKTVFKLIHGDSRKQYGTISFNGKFVFRLDDSIDKDLWNKIGFIKVDDSKCVESDDLFRHLNARLPIPLRDESNQVKIEYIKKTGLRVASDNFYLDSQN